MGSFLSWIIPLCFIAACFKQGCLQKSPIILSSTKDVVLENSSVALTCSNTTGVLMESQWRTSLYERQQAICYVHEMSCKRTVFLENSALFDCICNSNGSYTVWLHHVDRYQHGSTWMCRVTFDDSNIVVINVSVPVTHATLTQSGNGPIYENRSATFTCTSSYSLPSPQIHWFRSNSSSTVEITGSQDVEIERKTQTGEDNVIRVAETLSYRVNRSLNGWNVYCTATNWQNNSATSRIVELSVIYPPDSPPVIDALSNGSTYKVIENESANLSCTVKGGNPLAKPEWHCEGINSITSNERRTDNETVTSYLSWTAQRTNGTKCACKTGHALLNESTYINIDVLYPPGIPNIHVLYISEKENIILDAKLIEHRNYSLLCTVDANPSSEYIWSGPQGTVLTNISSLELYDVDRKQNGTYTCRAQTTMRPTYGGIRTKENDKSVNVDILYPPDMPPVIDGVPNGSTYKVVENENGNLSCRVKQSNPRAKVEWHCEHINNVTFIRNISDNVVVTSYLFWMATRTDGKTCTCKIIHYLLNVSMHVDIDVLYPPEIPTLQLQHETERTIVTSDAKLIQHKSYRLLCSAVSNPPPEYIWNGPQPIDASPDLSNVKRIHKGTYTCHARNKMHPTFGESFTKDNSSSINIDILYKPTLAVIYNQDVVEYSTLNITCKVLSSNPNDTYFKWTRATGDFDSNSKELVLQNVSRRDAMNYTCTVKNNMKPTVGEEEEGYASESFFLNVYYRASVSKFVVNGHENNLHIIINESIFITFTCEIDSNPNSTVKIITPNGTEIISTSTNVFEYEHFLSSCTDNGTYTCSGSNDYNNGQPGLAKLPVFVKCTPMAYKHIETDLRSKLYVPVTFQFRAVAYPEPTFTWEKWANSSWKMITNDSMFSVSSRNLQSNLTVFNFTSATGSVYRLTVKNKIGSFIQNYTLKPFDRPETPKEFRHIEESLTDTSVTLIWKPGFNGGVSQTFVITYTDDKDGRLKTVTLQDTEQYLMNLTIGGLSSSTNYVIYLSAVNSEGSTGNVTLQIKTKGMAKEVLTETRSIVGPVVGSITVAIVVIFVALAGIVIYRKRSSSEKGSESSDFVYQNVQFAGECQKKKVNAKVPFKKETSFQTLQELDDAPPIYKEPTKYYNSPDKIEQFERIKVSELLPFVLGSSEESFATEYQKLPTELQKPCVFARKPDNIAMNRYNGIYPYDHSRVKIPDNPDFFINACYIDFPYWKEFNPVRARACSGDGQVIIHSDTVVKGYAKQNEYVASLGPTIDATDHFKTFWMMVWNEQSDIIVMLTNLNESSGMKCERYWPELGTTETYGDIQVTSDKEDVFAEYTTRSFIVSNAKERRSVAHLHYTAWPDKRVPEDVTTLIEFRQRIKTTPSTKKGPLIVHCSAGIGRTGTLIALDRLIQEGQCESSVDVFKCVNGMREQRVKMVQTLEQYICIYKALVNSLYFDSEVIPIESFQEYVDQTNNNIYSRQFQQLKDSVETCCEEESSARARNEMLVDKNRKSADIPGNQNRVCLHQHRNTETSDYINAVYANSFKKIDHFILAQSPLPNTVADFVGMIYQENCCCVVTMEDLTEPRMGVCEYLPTDGHAHRFGDMQISCITLESKPQYTVKEIRLHNCGQITSREKVAYHFQYSKWVQSNDTPADAEEFVQFIKTVAEYSDQLGDGKSHVLVHCLNANERSALFSIVAILTEKIRYERQVNVLNTIRHLRTRRRSAITSMEQLKFCYKAVQAYIELFET